MRLFLLRHGQSRANLQGLVTGSTSDTLSAEGIRQAREAEQLLAGIPRESINCFSSQWQRARQTASHLLPDMRFEVDNRLGETDAGDAAELKLASFLELDPDFYSDPGNCYPQGESHRDLNDRVLDWLSDMRRARGHVVLAVTHAGPICCLLQHALDIPLTRFPAMLPAHASLSVIDYPLDDERHAGTVLAFSLLAPARLHTFWGMSA